MRTAALGAAFVTMALVLTSRTSAAQGRTSSAPVADSEAVSLLYEDSPPADCPTQAAFEAEVTKLTSKARFTKERRARRVRIELDSSGHDVVGRLISGDGKNQSSREVRGKDCKEVSSALAIAVALTIDPEALLGDSEPTPTETPGEPVKTPPATVTKPTPEPKQPKTPLVQPPAKPTPTKLWWGVGGGLELENAWGPRMAPGIHAFGLLGLNDRLRVSLGVTRFITREVDDMSFGAWIAETSLSFNIALLGALRPFAGVGFELGAVDAAGTGLPAQVQAQRAWRAASAGLGLRLETESFFLQLGGSLLVPLSRQRYLISDPLGDVRTVYEVPNMGLKQETSLGVFL
ncbi:MAG TPA: hypothetical protein VHP33_31885 [Polyangiaceae bacterium]|nr:hypothetical protein [Polyangiaceae bacterium]